MKKCATRLVLRDLLLAQSSRRTSETNTNESGEAGIRFKVEQLCALFFNQRTTSCFAILMYEDIYNRLSLWLSKAYTVANSNP